MRRLLLTLLSTATVLFPAGALAVSVETYHFKAGSINVRWEGLGAITMEQQPSGVMLRSGDGTGYLLTDALPSFHPEAATVVVSAENETTFGFGWTQWTDAKNTVSSVELSTPAGTELPLSFSLRQDPKWNGDVGKIGIVLPPHTSLLLHEIAAARWSYFEKIGFMLQSFWTFDEYRPYSINFTWGPLLATNPVELSSVYQHLPPQQLYGFYAIGIGLVILLAALVIFGIVRTPKGSRKRWIVPKAFILLLAAWIVLDLRMGGEFLSWVKHDHQTYIAAPAEMRTFRDRERFYDFASFAAPLVADRGTYVFFAQQAWPYMGNIRYLTYPSIPGIDLDYDDTWVVYNRPDLTISDAGQIIMDGDVISFPGTVIGRFDDSSFVFRVTTNQ